MTVQQKPITPPSTSLSYVTIGAILTVVAGTSFFFWGFNSGHPVIGYTRTVGLILGIALLLIGFGVGRIGQVSGESQPVPAQPHAEPATNPSTFTTANSTRNV